MSDRHEEDFCELSARYLADELSPVELAEFDKLLAENPSFCKQLSLFAYQARLLRTRLATELITNRDMNTARQVLGPIDTANDDRATLVLESAIPFDGAPRRFVVTPRVWGLAASVLLIGYFAALVGLLAWDRFERFTSRDLAASPTDKESFATLCDQTDCQWAETPPSLGASFAYRLLKLKKGSAQLKFAQGASVTVEGPAEFEVRSPQEGFLHRGKLVAVVPPQATGFSVETPTARVVDLGTEFGVEVGDSGTTEVQVSKGKVKLHPGNPANRLSGQSAITLSAGTGRRIEINATGELVVHDVTYDSRRIGQSVNTKQSLPLPVAGVMASSEYGLMRQANNLINGNGLHGNRHVNFANGTMWVSAVGHVEDEFVLFDLGQARRLDTMKVWNYNELRVDENDRNTTTLYQERGVAVADIYISDTGNWNPLKRPDDWRLVIADQRFTPADGTTNYATPDLIQLNHVTARFIAIVIKTKHRANQPTPEMRCVGLSEVQFYGERILRKEFPNQK